ncbi:MAG TPA: NADH-quinone oxidoreductase subunit K [Anaerolineae bacterium]|nr:NADH-quinone oxidoreductase subunit K [Anaerolineae bacterium]
MTSSPLEIVFIGILGLLCVGLYGLLVLRNLIKIMVALQILGKAAILALAMAGQASGSLNVGQSLAVTVIVADTIVAVVGLALAVQVRRRFGTLDVKTLSTLQG